MGFFKDFAKDMKVASAASKAVTQSPAKGTGSGKTIAEFGDIYLYEARFVSLRHKQNAETRYLRGVTARVEAGEALESRITAARIVLTGVFALAWRKKSGGESWLTIEGPNFLWVERVERGQADQARAFATRVNAEVKKLPKQ